MANRKDVVFGIDVMELATLTGATDTEGTYLAVQARSFSIDNEVDTENFDANNQRIATRKYNKRITGSFEFANHTPALLALLGDGEVTTTGTSPNQSVTYAESAVAGDTYIRARMRSLSGDGTVTEVVALKIQPQGASLDFGTGAFAPVATDFEGIGDAVDNNLWTVTSHSGTNAVLTWA